jgi:hypothetical protein
VKAPLPRAEWQHLAQELPLAVFFVTALLSAALLGFSGARFTEAIAFAVGVAAGATARVMVSFRYREDEGNVWHKLRGSRDTVKRTFFKNHRDEE